MDATRWRVALLAGSWLDGFAASGAVWRHEVFAVADRWREGTVPATQFVAAVLAWGQGLTGYGPYRAARSLAPTDAGDRLESALAGLRSDKPSADELVQAYKRFATTSKLPWLGPAFFTKVLYFAGYRRGRGGIQPLILDRVVASRLPADAGAASRYRTGWWSSTWHDYLVWAGAQSARPEYSGEPDAVEMALFTGAWRPAPPGDGAGLNRA